MADEKKPDIQAELKILGKGFAFKVDDAVDFNEQVRHKMIQEFANFHNRINQLCHPPK